MGQLEGWTGNDASGFLGGWRKLLADLITWCLVTIGYVHHETHAGNRYFCLYSVASLGAMATPDDTITLTWTTPNTTEWEHFTFMAKGTAGWRIRLIEAPSGGAANQTGEFTMRNRNRNSANTASCIALDAGVGDVSYDATLATGGITLWDEYLEGTGGPQSGGSGSGAREEIVLKQNTKYQLSLYGTDTDPATIGIDFYEHTNKA